MARTVFHVVPTTNGWGVKKEGEDRPRREFSTKNDAITFGRNLCLVSKPSQLKIHKMDGTIETEYTYGDDPFPPRG